MVFINEWLPNPVGPDAAGEFIELFNGSDESVNLAGWTLRTDTKKKSMISGLIRANGYAVFKRSQTKLSLKNMDEKLLLYDPVGKLVDQSSFEGSAPEGKSLNCIIYRAAETGRAVVRQFVWGDPSPGAKNASEATTGISAANYPSGVPLNDFRLGWLSILDLALAAGVIFAAVLWYAVKENADIPQLFFGGDEGFRP